MAGCVADANGGQVAALLDHARLSSAEPSLYPDQDRLRRGSRLWV
ncbi:hypothetical protein ABWJ92_34125 [Streptomyces sp. NPDC000609]